MAALYYSAWRHWGCTTPLIIDNLKKSFSKADELDGFDELQPADQDKIRKAWDDGHVADKDVPETARKPDADDGANDEAKPKKKRASPKKDDEGDVAKPKKAARTSKKVSLCPCCFSLNSSHIVDPLAIHRSPKKRPMQRMTVKKQKSPRKLPHQSLAPR